jgi:signal transduction histidine kinase
LLEDNELDAELIAEQLAAAGFEAAITRVESKAEFERALAGGTPDVVLADFSLPSYDGLSALAAARQIASEVPFIFVSGAIGEELAIDTLRRGATDYVLKGRLHRLGPAVSRALDEREERAARRRAEEERDRLLVLETQARRQAEAASRMKDEFLAVVSHELRTPLNAILGWATLLQTKHSDPALLKKGLGIVERNARVQARLIEDILDISRVITGKLKLKPETVSVESFILAALESVRPAAEAKSIKLSVAIAPDTGRAVGDPDRLQQVMWNLVSNSVKFTGAGGRVTVSASRVGGEIRLQVKDDGQGIAPDVLPYVFERFRQGDASTTRTQGGLGLGLAIVRHLVEMHGGTVSAVSDGPGKGALFTVRLPIRATLPARDTPVPPAQLGDTRASVPDIVPSLEGLTVLVVDDERDSRELVGEVLETHGAEVVLSSSVSEALERLSQGVPHVLVSDIGMPVVDGYSLIRRVRALSPERGGKVPAIALTAYAHEIDRREAVAAGFQRHVAKPVEPSKLVSLVAEVARLEVTRVVS